MKGSPIHTKKILMERRRELRKNPTHWERQLWLNLRNKNLGDRFQRQHSIGAYIVDFYCAKKKLIIEIDGGTHSNQDAKQYDADRTRYFDALDLKVLRFWNSEIDNDMPAVLEKIKKHLGAFT
jgi:very-short-patch-repair endonuclease